MNALVGKVRSVPTKSTKPARNFEHWLAAGTHISVTRQIQRVVDCEKQLYSARSRGSRAFHDRN